MATASAVVSRRGNDQFRGLFSDTWAVRATLDAGSLVDGAGETDDVTIPGVALGDMVIGAVIGPGGKVIQEIQRETGTTINIEEVGNTGVVSIFCAEKAGLEKALSWVKGITAVPEVGDVYEGPVKGIKEFGAFIEFMPGKQGLLHISEISWSRLETMDGIFKEGDMVKVKLVGLDPKTGKFKLSHKALIPRPGAE